MQRACWENELVLERQYSTNHATVSNTQRHTHCLGRTWFRVEYDWRDFKGWMSNMCIISCILVDSQSWKGEFTSFYSQQIVISGDNPFHTTVNTPQLQNSRQLLLTKRFTVQQICCEEEIMHTHTYRSINCAYHICQTRLSCINVCMQYNASDSSCVCHWNIKHKSKPIFDDMC